MQNFKAIKPIHSEKFCVQLFAKKCESLQAHMENAKFLTNLFPCSQNLVSMQIHIFFKVFRDNIQSIFFDKSQNSDIFCSKSGKIERKSNNVR